ncbi:MAG: xanthine dehydrogenase family protein molybdopterin-binding subunit [Sneathiella sp.]
MEDDPLIRGNGCYVDDVPLEDPLYITFLRSTSAHGTLQSMDISDALDLPDVEGIFCGDDVSGLGDLAVNKILKDMSIPPYPVLAHQTVDAIGQPIAGIAAKTAQAGLDALDLIAVDIDDKPASLPFHNHDPQKKALQQSWRGGDPETAFQEASHQVSVTVEHPRLAPSPMENRAIAVQYHQEDSVTVYLSSQTPHRARKELSRILQIAPEKIQVISPDVGGAFGMKASLYPEEVFTVWTAFKLKQSVKWTSTRNEDLLSASHGRGARSRASLAFDADGTFRGLKAEIEAPLGHWLPNSAAIPAWNAARILPGPYRINDIEASTTGYLSHTAPVGIYRGAGRPEATLLMERLVEAAARKLQMDPFHIRKLNLLTTEELPRINMAGSTLDSGDYPAALERLKNSAQYDALCQKIIRRRQEGDLAGLGLSFYVEPCGQGWESATVTLHPNGKVTAATGTSSQGHGRATAFRQILSEVFDLPFSEITFFQGDTNTCPEGIGALASRSTAIGGSALKQAAEQVLAKSGGSVTPAQDITVTVKYENEGEAWGYGCYLAEISIDAPTGKLTVEKLTCVDDAGTLINPMMVEGQIMGGVAQGIGEALMEQIRYDESGQLLTGSLMDYALPRANDMPDLHIEKMTTPSPKNLLGAKGVGEAGTNGAPAAILNAALDALSPYAIETLQMPLTSENIWRALQNAKGH